MFTGMKRKPLFLRTPFSLRGPVKKSRITNVRRRDDMILCMKLDIFELGFGEVRLLEDFSHGAGGDVSTVHRYES
jgi:hypothetical protein